MTRGVTIRTACSSAATARVLGNMWAFKSSDLGSLAGSTLRVTMASPVDPDPPVCAAAGRRAPRGVHAAAPPKTRSSSETAARSSASRIARHAATPAETLRRAPISPPEPRPAAEALPSGHARPGTGGLFPAGAGGCFASAIIVLSWAWSVPGRLASRAGTVSLGSLIIRRTSPEGRFASAPPPRSRISTPSSSPPREHSVPSRPPSKTPCISPRSGSWAGTREGRTSPVNRWGRETYRLHRAGHQAKLGGERLLGVRASPSSDRPRSRPPGRRRAAGRDRRRGDSRCPGSTRPPRLHDRQPGHGAPC